MFGIGEGLSSMLFLCRFIFLYREKRGLKYDRRGNDRRKDRVYFMIADREVKKEIKGQTRFVVTREFGGTQTMQQAFEQLIEKKTEEHISKNAPHSRKKDRQAV